MNSDDDVSAPLARAATFNDLLAQGYLLRHACGYHDGQRYAGIWEQPGR